MWISKDRLRKKEKAAHVRGLELGYNLGLQVKRTEELEGARCANRKSIVDLQIEEILLRKSREV